MKARDFQEWMDATGCSTAADVARVLGLHRNSAQKILAEVKRGEDVGIKLTVALAMTATAEGRPAWGE